METSLEVMKAVESQLIERGIKATLEYPGFIYIGDRAYGNANSEWGWVNGFSGGNQSGSLGIANEETDVRVIVDAIARVEAIVERAKNATELAELAFWKTIADSFHEATSGDLDPLATIKLTAAMEYAVWQWITANVPGVR